MPTVRVFKYIEQLDAFVVTDDYRHLTEQLGLIEWHPVVWIGRRGPKALIERVPGQARTIRVLLPPEVLPDLA